VIGNEKERFQCINIYGSQRSSVQSNYSGVGIRGSGGSMNQGPELLGATESWAKKFYARKEYATSEKKN